MFKEIIFFILNTSFTLEFILTLQKNKLSVSNFFSFLEQNKILIFVPIITCLIMYGIKLFHFTIGIDTELYMGKKQFINWLSIGRFGLVLLQKLWIYNFFNPFTAVFVALIFFIFSIWLWLYVIDFYSKGKIKNYTLLFFALIYETSQVWSEQMFFTLQCAEIMFATFLIPLCVIWLIELVEQQQKNIFYLAINFVGWVFFACFLISIYQSFILLIAVGFIACFILQKTFTTEKTQNNKKINWQICIKAFCLLIFALFLYIVLNNIILKIYAIEQSDYLIEKTKNHRGERINFLHNAFLYFYTRTFCNIGFCRKIIESVIALHAQSGMKAVEVLQQSYQQPNYILIILIISFIFYSIKNSQKSFLYILLNIALIISIYICPVMGNDAIRVKVMNPFIFGFMTMLVIHFLPHKINITAILITTVVCFFNIQNIADFQYSDKLRYDADVRFAQIINDRLLHCIEETNAPADIPIIFAGNYKHNYLNYVKKGETCGYSSFEWVNNINDKRPLAFMRTLGMIYSDTENEKIVEQAQKISLEMPCYPDKNCIRNEGDFIIIKLSD